MIQNQQPRGQNIVEFALTIGISIFFVLMIFEFGRVIFTYSVLSGAAREGARFASVNHDDPDTRESQIDAYIRTRVPGLDASLDEPKTLNTGFAWQPPGTKEISVTVTLSYAYGAILPFFPLNLNTRSSMNLEY